MASLVNYGSIMSNTNRLETIANRQRRSRVRDLAFAALVVIAGATSVMGIVALG